LSRGEKKLIKGQQRPLSKVEKYFLSLKQQDKTTKTSRISDTSIRQGHTSRIEYGEPQEISVDSKIKNIKNKLANPQSYMEPDQDFEEWIKQREFEILKLENEINILPLDHDGFNLKLKEISMLKNEVKVLKDKMKRGKASQRSLSASHSRSLTPPDVPVSKQETSISTMIQPSSSRKYQTNPLSHSKSVSILQSKGLPELDSDSRIMSVRDASAKKQNPPRYDTPKFEQSIKPIVKNASARIIPIAEREQEHYHSESTYPDASYRETVSPKRVTFNEGYHSETPKRTEDSIIMPKDKIRSSIKEYFSSGQPEFISRRNTNEDIPKESERLRAQKARKFDILDEDEEFIVTGKVDDCKLDKLTKRYKNLYYKARELKTLLNEFAENNADLKNELDDAERDRKILLEENQKMKEQFEKSTKKLTAREDDLIKQNRELENKLIELENERNYLNQKVEELQKHNEFLNMRLTAQPNTLREQQLQTERTLTLTNNIEVC